MVAKVSLKDIRKRKHRSSNTASNQRSPAYHETRKCKNMTLKTKPCGTDYCALLDHDSNFAT